MDKRLLDFLCERLKSGQGYDVYHGGSIYVYAESGESLPQIEVNADRWFALVKVRTSLSKDYIVKGCFVKRFVLNRIAKRCVAKYRERQNKERLKYVESQIKKIIYGD